MRDIKILVSQINFAGQIRGSTSYIFRISRVQLFPECLFVSLWFEDAGDSINITVISAFGKL